MGSLSKRIISVHGEKKMKILRKAVGAWKGTALDDDSFWKEVLQRKSRKARSLFSHLNLFGFFGFTQRLG